MSQQLSLKPTKKQIKHMQHAEYDTIVQCPICHRTQYLMFKNGLKNGWDTCCNGLTMPIIYQEADIDKAVKEIVQEALLKEVGK